LASDPVHAVADALSAIRFDGLPARTVTSARRLVLDSLAVALAGYGCRDVQVLAGLAREWGGRPESTLLGSAERVPAPVAALVNGTMIQALDFDDTHDPSGAHTASTVLAAALAVAEPTTPPIGSGSVTGRDGPSGSRLRGAARQPNATTPSQLAC